MNDDRLVIDTLRFYQNDRGIDFAGRFTLAQINCGAGCIRLAAVDALSGQVRWFGQTITNWPMTVMVPLAYQSTSRLLGVLGELDEAGRGGWHWFDFDGGEFVPLPALPKSCRLPPPKRD
ncbi:hypothetical protein NFI95_00665 [Acetobacteraceae bacterium KSS8]|uniref:Uncharacterized protein n=1 Tax=Endosaccharibacter trunci TaxID=2812733 RepID=A0ABT1W3X0_9PROT|nr:hypothetical protein [Acetobacteraceae bacterium KSS8]